MHVVETPATDSMIGTDVPGPIYSDPEHDRKRVRLGLPVLCFAVARTARKLTMHFRSRYVHSGLGTCLLMKTT